MRRLCLSPFCVSPSLTSSALAVRLAVLAAPKFLFSKKCSQSSAALESTADPSSMPKPQSVTTSHGLGAYKVVRTKVAPSLSQPVGAPPQAEVISPKVDTTPKVKTAPTSPLSCGQEFPAPVRPLTALQKRMVEKRDKKIFALTQNAVYRVKTLLAMHSQRDNGKEGTPVGIRIGVKKKGCSGYSYTVNYEFEKHTQDTTKQARSSESVKKDEDDEDDLEAQLAKAEEAKKKKDPIPPPTPAALLLNRDYIVEQNNVRVFVDGDALFYVIGTEMDFTISNVEEKFVFQNPNLKSKCGCGESFMPSSDL